MLHPREQQQQTEESRKFERSDDDRHIGLFLDGDLVTGIERKLTDPKPDR
jgi:hypothetical protein